MIKTNIALACTAIALSACNPPANVDNIPKVDCQNVDANIEKQKGVRPSPELQLVEKLACYYGASIATYENVCSIPVYPPVYFKDGTETYGLKDGTAAQLIDAESYGNRQSFNVTLWMTARGIDSHDQDTCFRKIHDVPESFEALVSLTRRLKNSGY